jgi:hypothetical protein
MRSHNAVCSARHVLSAPSHCSWCCRPLWLLRRRQVHPRPPLRKTFQFTQEVRFASADSTAIQLSGNARLRWQSGVFLFTQSYEQDAINSFSPFVVAPLAVSQHGPESWGPSSRSRRTRDWGLDQRPRTSDSGLGIQD